MNGSFKFIPSSSMQYLILTSVMLLMPTISSGQDRSLLAFSVRNLASSIRSNSPVSLECKLEYTQQRLLEGHLKLDLFDVRERVGTVQIDDIVLSGGDYEFNAILPPFTPPSSKAIDLYPTFITANEEIKMEPIVLIVSGSMQRGTLGMFIIDTSTKSPAQSALENAIKPNRFNFYSDWTQQQRDTILGATRIDFYQARYDYADVPVSALRYCVADLVAICDETFGKLREKQMAAMEQWIKAGGCAAIIPDGQLSAEHLAFLNRLADIESRQGVAPFIVNDAGNLDDREFATPGYELYHCGLGRVAIISPTVDLDALTDAEIGPLNGFLWRIRAKYPEVLDGETWRLKKKRQQQVPQYRGQPIPDGNDLELYESYTHARIPAIHGMMRRTMPEDVKIIPFGIVGGLLVLYVLAIGPGDYFLLGLFKLRKLTWIVFPIVTLAFTLFTVWLSHHYMGSGDEGKPVVFVDVIKGNQVARTSRFSLIFSGSQKRIVEEIDGAIATGLNQHAFGGYDPAFSGRGMPNETGTYSMPRYAGRFPTQYRMIQQVGQWSPQLNRTFRIAPKIQLPNFDWDNPGIDGRLPRAQQTQAITELGKRIKKSFGRDASVFLFGRNKIHQIINGKLGRLFNDEQISRGYGYDPIEPGQRQPANVLYEACARSPIRLFDVMYQISPTGAENFEDLTLLDETDEKQWLLVVITEEADGFKVYRRLYNEDEKTPVLVQAEIDKLNLENGKSAEPQ